MRRELFVDCSSHSRRVISSLVHVSKKAKIIDDGIIEKTKIILDRKMYDIYHDLSVKSVNCNIRDTIKLLEFFGFDINISKKGSHIKINISSLNDNKIKRFSLIMVDRDFLHYYESVRVIEFINIYFIVVC